MASQSSVKSHMVTCSVPSAFSLPARGGEGGHEKDQRLRTGGEGRVWGLGTHL